MLDIRRAHHLFPIRSYLPSLVTTLEDPDANVRECAKQTVPELFTGPGVTDAARADLKKELTKKSVRKGIVDIVLAKIAAGPSTPVTTGPATPGPGLSSPTLESDDGVPKKEYVSPSVALMGRRPAAGSGTPGSSFRPTRSTNPTVNTSRPGSRAAVAPPVETPPAESSSSGELKPVYVSSTRQLQLLASANSNILRLPQTRTWRTNLQLWLSLTREKSRNTTGPTGSGPFSESEA